MIGTKRINWVDWAKCYGIFLVVLGHIVYPDNLYFLLKFIYGFHMPFFLLMSGYLFKPETYSFKKDVRSLLIPYLLFNLIMLVVFYLPVGFYPYGLKSLVRNMLLGTYLPPIEALWFLPALFWAKLISHYLFRFLGKYAWVGALLVGVAAYLNGVELTLFDRTFRLPFFIPQGLLSVPFVMLGYYVKKQDWVDRIYHKKDIMLVSVLILLPVYCWLAYRLDIFRFVDIHLTEFPVAGVAMVLIGCYLFLLFCRMFDPFENRFVQRISVGTIVVLAIHQKIYLACRMLFEPSFGITLIICCLIMVLSYFLTGFLLRYCPILLGGKKKAA